MKPLAKDIFRAYDIRGVAENDFDDEWVHALGRAVGTFLVRRGYRRTVVGMDCRHSSPGYEAEISRGLQDSGCHVARLGMVSTPLFYHAAKKLGVRGGVMVTASHNPPEYNGFKIWCGSATIHTTEIDELYQIMSQGAFEEGAGAVGDYDPEPSYLSDLARLVSMERAVKVVVDGGNGAGGETTARLLERVGARVVRLHCRPDGNFPNHHPDPVVEENARDLAAMVLETGADFGVGLDGDGDRIGVVDENGRLVSGDELTAILAADVLEKNPGAVILGDVKCSHKLFNHIRKRGGEPVMCPTGHSLMKAKMAETGALLAGEMSGHLFFGPPMGGVDDASFAAARVAEVVSGLEGKGLSQALDNWPETFATPEMRVHCPDKAKFQLVERAAAMLAGHDVSPVDGVRVNFGDGWGLIRASNTQPALTMRFEAESEERLAEIRRIMEEPVLEWIREAQA